MNSGTDKKLIASSILSVILGMALMFWALTRIDIYDTDNLTLIGLCVSITAIAAYTVFRLSAKQSTTGQTDVYRLFPDSNPDPVFRLSSKGNIEYANPAAYSLLQQISHSPDARFVDLLPTDLDDRLKTFTRLNKQREIWEYPRQNRFFRGAIHSLTNDKCSHLYLTDITQQKNTEHELIFQATHNPLTSLPNRQILQDNLEDRLHKADPFALMSISLDRLQVISGSLGYTIGDAVTTAVAERFVKVLEQISDIPGDFCLFQLDNADFTVILDQYKNPSTLSRIAHRFMKCMDTPLYILNREYFTTISIGISIFPEDGQDSITLLRNADSARHRAITEDGNSEFFYSHEMSDTQPETLSLENFLRHAIEHNELEIYYQPQICIKSCRAIGMEAVLRWNHPERGFVMPDKFIPIAEETGLITPIGDWLLYEACKQTRLWQDNGIGGLTLAVNVSRRQFHPKKFVERVNHALTSTGLKAATLELEITESAALRELDETKTMLAILKDQGINLSIDDFGTGWSSLTYLKHFSVNKIKIDQSFVKNLIHDPFDAAICRSVITLGHSLGMTVLAEGVESIEQLNWLKNENCDQIQGYYYSKPLPATEFETYVRSMNKH